MSATDSGLGTEIPSAALQGVENGAAFPTLLPTHISPERRQQVGRGLPA